MNTRKKCLIDGCERLGRNKGYYKGTIRYDKVCEIHHRGKERSHFYLKSQIQNISCERCGWNKAPCDRHRIIPEKGYTRENVIILCPNCHRLESMNSIII